MQELSQTKKKKGRTMDSFLFFILFIVGYFALQYFVLPKLGVPT